MKHILQAEKEDHKENRMWTITTWDDESGEIKTVTEYEWVEQ